MGASIACLMMLFSPQSVSESWLSAIKLQTDHEFGTRTRYQANTDSRLGDANAFTTRFKLSSTFLLGEDEAWAFHLEPNFVYAINDGDYNSITVNQPTSPIPDPKGLTWNNVNLKYTSNGHWHAKLGRQAIAYDNERMIGTQEFWQTPQSFDAISIGYNDQINWNIRYAYANKVHRIYGNHAKAGLSKDDHRYPLLSERPVSELGVHQLDAHFINLSYTTDEALSLTTYGYLLHNQTHRISSSDTFGIKIEDEFKPHRIKYRYAVEFATQKSNYNNLANYRTWYNFIKISAQYKSHTIELNQELFSEDNNNSFRTSLGSLHKFQGWSDASSGYYFGAGMRDQYLTYRGRHKKWRWRGVWHRFLTFSDKEKIGTEFNAELAYRLTRQWELKFIYADYDAKKGTGINSRLNTDVSAWFISVAYNI